MRYVLIAVLLTVPSVGANTSMLLDDFISSVNPSLGPVKAYKLAREIRHFSEVYHMDTYLVASIIAVESKFNSKAIGKLGEVGLMQLRPEYHCLYQKDYEKRVRDMLLPSVNVQAGIKYLAGLKAVFGAEYQDNRWVELYNRGPSSKPKKFPYYRKVMQYYKMLGAG